MDDVALVPVEHQPDFENVSLVPVDHDPFSAGGAPQQVPSQQAQSQAAQPLPQQPATRVERLYVGPAAKNTEPSEAGESWDPDIENNDTSGPIRSTASTPAQDKPAYDWSHFNQPFGELNPAAFTPTQQIGYQAADVLTALGMQPYTANDLATRIGNVLGLTPLVVAGSALDLIDAKRRDDLPGALIAAAGMIPPAKGVGQIAEASAASVLDKLNRYLLDPDHIRGGAKAKWFEQALGFARENAENLAKQLVFDKSQAIQEAVTQHGTLFNQTINVIGANGRTIPVTTGWIIGPDGVPRLTTAFPSR